MDSDFLPEDREEAKRLGVNLYTMSEILTQGMHNTDFKVVEPKYEDVYMLSYTSGTTGYPKGVKLSHKMMINCVAAVNYGFDEVRFDENDTYISYLPYAHIFE